MECGPVTCTIQYKSKAGIVLRKKEGKGVFVYTGNEGGETSFAVGLKVPVSFVVQQENVRLFTSFVSKGMATVQLSKDNCQILIQGASPDRLIRFLKFFMACLAGRPPQLEDESTNNFAESCKQRKRSRSVDENANVAVDMSLFRNKRSRQSRSGSIGSPDQVFTAVQLSGDQQRVMDAVKNGKNVFFTGSAGTGKTELLRQLCRALPSSTTHFTATTGLAACHIGGVTIFQFAAFGLGKHDVPTLCQMIIRRDGAVQRWKSAKTLVIDEVSMLDAELFDKLDAVARRIRGNNAPFGGMQMVLSGDFLQLPPVSKQGETKRKFCFEAKAWKDFECVMLRHVFRQSDRLFVNILRHLREGNCTTQIEAQLRRCIDRPARNDGIVPTKLHTHKADVDGTNRKELDKLPGKCVSYRAHDTGTEHSLQQLSQACTAKAELVLKVGAQVILLKNVDVGKGLANGTRGIVTAFSEREYLPIIRVSTGAEAVVRPEQWTLRNSGRKIASRLQLPLDLGWALSVHKSQGMSLDCVELSLAKVFEDGQAYVALSRVRSLEGLTLIDFDPTRVRANYAALAFYRNIERDAEQTTSTTRQRAASIGNARTGQALAPQGRPRAGSLRA